MALARRLLWLSAFAGIVYVVWRWRNQQADAAGVPAYTPPTYTPPAPAPPSPGPAGAIAAQPAGESPAPRRIPTRVHRGAPPSAGTARGAAPEPAAPDVPDAPPEPTAPPAAAALEAAVGAAKPEPVEPEPAEPEPAEPEPAEPAIEAGAVDLAPLVGPDAAGEAIDLAPLVSPEAALGAAGLPGALVNINTADHDALVALPGIGPALARRIIAHREEHGLFTSVEQLVDVQGIGARNLDEFRHLITV